MGRTSTKKPIGGNTEKTPNKCASAVVSETKGTLDLPSNENRRPLAVMLYNAGTKRSQVFRR